MANPTTSVPKGTTRINASLKEIQRHWIGEGRRRDKTIQSIRQALEFRRSYRIVELRSLFATSDKDWNQRDRLHKQWIEEDLKRQLMVVRGSTITSNDFNNNSRRSAMVFKPPRGSPTDAAENEAYIITQIYTAERVLATTEYLQGQQEEDYSLSSTGCSDKLLVLFSFEDYRSSQSLTTKAMTTSSQVLQRVYPERLFQLLILEPPFWMRTLMTLMYPFLSSDTARKLQLVTGKVSKVVACGGGRPIRLLLLISTYSLF
jgi:hypothetical protein